MMSWQIGLPSESPATAASHYCRMDFDDDIEWNHDFLRSFSFLSFKVLFQRSCSSVGIWFWHLKTKSIE